MFTAWGDRKVSEYWENVFRCGKSGFTVNRGAVNRGFTVCRYFYFVNTVVVKICLLLLSI